MSKSTLSDRAFGALLFDMDGTIISSVAAAERVWPLGRSGGVSMSPPFSRASMACAESKS